MRSSPVVPGKFFIFVEQHTVTNYHTLVIEADSSDEAIAKAQEMVDNECLPPKGILKPMTIKSELSFKAKPMREHHIQLSNDQFDALTKTLDENPLANNQKLNELLAKPKRWVNESMDEQTHLMNSSKNSSQLMESVANQTQQHPLKKMKAPTLKEKVNVYERLLNLLALSSQHNPLLLRQILQQIQSWSQANRGTEETDREFNERIKNKFFQLREFINKPLKNE